MKELHYAYVVTRYAISDSRSPATTSALQEHGNQVTTRHSACDLLVALAYLGMSDLYLPRDAWQNIGFG